MLMAAVAHEAERLSIFANKPEQDTRAAAMGNLAEHMAKVLLAGGEGEGAAAILITSVQGAIKEDGRGEPLDFPRVVEEVSMLTPWDHVELWGRMRPDMPTTEIVRVGIRSALRGVFRFVHAHVRKNWGQVRKEAMDALEELRGEKGLNL